MLCQFAKHLNTKMANPTKLVFPKEFAHGYMQTFDLPNKLEVLLFDYTLVQDFYGKRHAADNEYYILWFTEAYIPEQANFLVENNSLETKTSNFTSVMLTSSMFDLVFNAKKGTRFNGLNFIMNKEWLYKNLGVTSSDEVLQSYLANNSQKISSEVLTFEYKKLWQDIIDVAKTDTYLKEVSIQNRCMLLIELFLLNMHKKLLNATNTIKQLHREDINRMMEAERFLCKDLLSAPPSLKAIARNFKISEAKLKKDFKELYNVAPHQHFQKKRMQAAKELLVLNKYSIKQIANEFGFSNQNNFTIAFKKEFGILPSQLCTN